MNSNVITSKTKNFLGKYYSNFEIYIKLLTFQKEHEPHSLSNSEIIYSEKRGYLNV